MGDTYVVTISDSSSIVNYYPHGDGGVGNWTQTGWQPFYAEAGGFATEGGEAASGNSTHITAYPGASLDFLFYGSAISLFGAANCSYDVSIDGNTTSFSSTHIQTGTLYSYNGLPDGLHNVSLVAHASTNHTLAFDGAAVTRTLATGVSLPTPHVYQATNTSLITYEGNWTVLNDPLIPSGQHPAPYLVTSVPSASLSFSFQGVGVAINGSRIWGSSVYNVTLNNQTETYNASTMWFIGDALLFYRDGLDPHQTHTVNVTPILAPGGFLKFWLNTVTVFTDDPSEVGGLLRDPTTQTRHALPPIGTLVGSVVGGVAGLVLFVATLWYCIRRKRENLAVYERDEPSPFLATAPTAPSRPHVLRDTKRPTIPSLPSGADVKRPPTIPDTVAIAVAPGRAPTASEPSLHESATRSVLQPECAALATPPHTAPGTHPATPGASTPATDPNVAVERIIQLLAERMVLEPLRPSVHSAEDAPPEYGA